MIFACSFCLLVSPYILVQLASWEELEFYGLDFFYSILGWNERSWAGLEEEPAKKSWKQLNEEETIAAIELCYSFETWEGYDLTVNFGPFPFAKPGVEHRTGIFNREIVVDVDDLIQIVCKTEDKTSWQVLLRVVLI